MEKIERLEAEVEELSEKEVWEDKMALIEKIVSLTAELLAIIAGILAIAEFLL